MEKFEFTQFQLIDFCQDVAISYAALEKNQGYSRYICDELEKRKSRGQVPYRIEDATMGDES